MADTTDTTTLPAFLDDQLDDQSILQDMIADVPSDLDVSEGGFIWDALAPASIQFAQAAQWAQLVLQYGFAQTTYGNYLDMRAGEHGLTRLAAQPATGTVTFTGTPGTLIPAGTQVSTTSTDTVDAVIFDTTEDATIPSGSTVSVGIEAEVAGTSGNVAASTVTLLNDTGLAASITSVNNDSATTGGMDTESDTAFLSRYLLKVRDQPTGGNNADYKNWALAVAGVGGASVVPVRDGPGTVSIAIIDTDKNPATQTLVYAVQNDIAPPWSHIHAATTMTQSGSGISTDTSQTDAGENVIKMTYSTSGTGELIDPTLQTILDRPGIWMAKPTMKVDSTAGTNDLVQFGVWDLSTLAWCKQSPSSSLDAVTTLKASDLSTSFGATSVDFYWDGSHQIEVHLTRLQSDTTTTLWVEQAELRSAFSQDTGEGKAPIGARVTVEPAGEVSINVSGTLVVATGYNPTDVQAAAQTAIVGYLQSIAYQDNNTVQYVKVGNAITDTAGVVECDNLTINGGTSNIAIGVQDVAVLGTVTWS